MNLASERRLETSTETALLKLLAETDEALEEMDASQECIALVSYRQERRWPDGSGVYADPDADPLTMDAHALHGIIEAARRLNAHAIWLDAWCYRFIGTYDHAEFCGTLSNVLAGVRAVVRMLRLELESCAAPG